MRALITGVTGQDGSYLAELLLQKGYEVYGIVRRLARENLARENQRRKNPGRKNLKHEDNDRLAGINGKVEFVEADLSDQTSLDRALQKVNNSQNRKRVGIPPGHL